MDLEYQILHDRSLPMAFIGDTFHNHTLYDYFQSRRSCEHISLEQALERDDDWYYSTQIMAAVTNVGFKRQLAESLRQRPTQWFSVVSTNTVLHHRVKVGHNTLINSYNVFYDDCKIGDHCTLTNYVMLSHEVSIGDMCHISPFTYLCYTELKSGVVVGVRSSFPGKPNDPITIAPWTNILMDSRVTQSISDTGTYYGNRRQSNDSSIDVKIL